MPFDTAHYSARVDVLLRSSPHPDSFGDIFSGPQIDLHIRTLRARQQARVSNEAREQFSWLIYCTLAAWGMHHQRAKMPRFSEFDASVSDVWTDALDLWDVEPPLDAAAWRVLERIFRRLRASITDSTLVANSKTLCHLLPLAVAPIDRNYVLSFFDIPDHWLQYGARDGNRAWNVLQASHEGFYYPLLSRPEFAELQNLWCDHEMSTSPLKLTDNLIVAHESLRRAGNGA